MAEQAHSSTEIGESGDKTNIQEILLELMKEMRGQFQDIRKDREQDRVDTKQEFQEFKQQLQHGGKIK
jgi:chromosome segregation and condensation protein ScpB